MCTGRLLESVDKYSLQIIAFCFYLCLTQHPNFVEIMIITSSSVQVT